MSKKKLPRVELSDEDNPRLFFFEEDGTITSSSQLGISMKSYHNILKLLKKITEESHK